MSTARSWASNFLRGILKGNNRSLCHFWSQSGEALDWSGKKIFPHATHFQCGYGISTWGILWLKREDFFIERQFFPLFPSYSSQISSVSNGLDLIHPLGAEIGTFSEILWICCLFRKLVSQLLNKYKLVLALFGSISYYALKNIYNSSETEIVKLYSSDMQRKLSPSAYKMSRCRRMISVGRAAYCY